MSKFRCLSNTFKFNLIRIHCFESPNHVAKSLYAAVVLSEFTVLAKMESAHFSRKEPITGQVLF